jgi:hypothetical protein
VDGVGSHYPHVFSRLCGGACGSVDEDREKEEGVSLYLWCIMPTLLVIFRAYRRLTELL